MSGIFTTCCARAGGAASVPRKIGFPGVWSLNPQNFHYAAIASICGTYRPVKASRRSLPQTCRAQTFDYQLQVGGASIRRDASKPLYRKVRTDASNLY